MWKGLPNRANTPCHHYSQQHPLILLMHGSGRSRQPHPRIATFADSTAAFKRVLVKERQHSGIARTKERTTYGGRTYVRPRRTGNRGTAAKRGGRVASGARTFEWMSQDSRPVVDAREGHPAFPLPIG